MLVMAVIVVVTETIIVVVAEANIVGLNVREPIEAKPMATLYFEIGLDPSSSAVKAGHVSGVHHAFKTAFLFCLRCTHPGAVPESSQGGSILSPAEALIGIHGIDPEKDGIPLKKVTDACNTCFPQRQIFTQQVLAKVLNQPVRSTFHCAV